MAYTHIINRESSQSSKIHYKNKRVRQSLISGVRRYNRTFGSRSKCAQLNKGL